MPECARPSMNPANLRRILSCSLSLVACAPPGGTDDTSGATAVSQTGATGEPTTGGTGEPAVCEPFAPFEIDVQAQPNGLYWRGDLSQLFIADDDENRILTRSDDGKSAIFAEIPNPSGDPGTDGLGQIDFAPDGSLYVPRFGFDDPSLGAVFRIGPDGQPAAVAGLKTDVRRVGLDFDDASGLLYVGTFTKDSGGVFTGWVAVVDPEKGTEQTLVDGLVKPVGVIALGGKLYVGDQPTRKIYSVDLADPALVLLTDELVSLDQFIHTSDDESFFSIAYDESVTTGYVYRVSTDGTYTTVAQGAWEPRGIAFDGVSRIFVSERDGQRIAVVPAC